jgi:hypothetical protein
MSLVDDVQSYLTAQGIAGGSTPWPCFRRYMPDDTAQCVVVTEDGGFEPEFPTDSGIGDSAEEEPAVQVRVRGARRDGDGPFGKMREIKEALHGKRFVTMGSNVYRRVRAQSGILFIGQDEKERPEFTLSFRAARDVVLTS